MLNISKYHKLIVGCSAIATAAVSGFVQSAEAAGQLQNQAAKSNSGTTLIAADPINNSNAGGVNIGGINNSNAGGGNNSNAGGPGIIVKGGQFGPYYFDSNNGGVVPNGGYYYDGNGPKGAGYYPYTGKGDAPYYFGKGPNGLGYYSYNVNAAANPPVVGPPGVIVKGGEFGPYYFDSNNGGVVTSGGYYYDANGPKGPGYYPYTGQGNAPYYFGKGPNGLGYYSYNVNATTPPVAGPPGIFVKGPNGDYYYDSNNGGAVPNGGYYYDAKGPNGPGYYPYTGNGNAPYYFGKGPNGLGYYSYNVNNVNVVNGSDSGAIGSAPNAPGATGGPTRIGPGGSNGRGLGGGGYSSSQIARSISLGSRISIASGKYDIASAALAAAEANQTPASSKTSPVRYGREVADASCPCLNSDTASTGDMSKQLIAAKEAEAAAAAELAAAKAEARQFLESVKGSESGGFSAYQPIW